MRRDVIVLSASAIKPAQPVASAARRTVLRCGAQIASLQAPAVGEVELEPDRAMVRWAEGQRIGGTAGEPMHQAAVETERHDIAGKMRRLARAHIVEAGQ